MSKVNFPEKYFQRYDENPDEHFYQMARKVVHIDDGAIAHLSQRYGELLPPQGVILDLMSSWRTHLPESYQAERVVGLGMNAEEMADNPQLDDYTVHNLNVNPTLPYDDASFDAVLCAVSVQYLTRPIAVFAAVNRVLKPGGVFVISFSNRCFPTKAVAVWLNTNDHQHVALVSQYLQAAGGYARIETEMHQPRQGDPLCILWAHKGA